MMVGEIRDRETADIAVQAALTGHLVLTTVHTNDALGAITRMRDMKVEPFLLASTLAGGYRTTVGPAACVRYCRETEQADGNALHRLLGFDKGHCGLQGRRAARNVAITLAFRGASAYFEAVRVSTIRSVA